MSSQNDYCEGFNSFEIPSGIGRQSTKQQIEKNNQYRWNETSYIVHKKTCGLRKNINSTKIVNEPI